METLNSFDKSIDRTWSVLNWLDSFKKYINFQTLLLSNLLVFSLHYHNLQDLTIDETQQTSGKMNYDTLYHFLFGTGSIWEYSSVGLSTVALITTIYMFINCKRNISFFNRTKLFVDRTINQMDQTTKVSIMVPARNEEKNIEACVRSLMRQNYANFEVLVMNDESTDKTADILESLESDFKSKYPVQKLFVYKNTAVPENWYGKAWALHSLAENATGQILIFTDADTIHEEGSVQFCVHTLNKNRVDFLSGSPKQNFTSFGLYLIVPSMFIMSSYCVPLWKMTQTRSEYVSHAIGQLMVVRKAAYDSACGFEEVFDKICEDLQFARVLRRLGFKTLFVGLEDFVSCNMYSSFKDAFFGMSKNVFSALDYKWTNYWYSTLIFGSIIYPFISIGLLVYRLTFLLIILDLLSILIFLASWINTLKYHKIPWFVALLYPFMMITMFSVSAYSTFVTFCTKGHDWKGRRVN